jgi:hypothetical protein
VAVQNKKATRGTIDKVPCPWCGYPQDFRDTEDFALGGAAGAFGYEKGAVFKCDNHDGNPRDRKRAVQLGLASCGRFMQLVSVKRPVLITVRQFTKQPRIVR